MAKSKVLLTGANGMVGRNLRDHPAVKEYALLAPSRAELDLTNPQATADYIAHHAPDLIIHTAGKVGGIQANMSAPVEFLDSNIMIGRNVIMGAKAAAVPRLINLASSCIYPADGHNPLHESSILTGALEPTNEGYALAKIFALRLCEYISRTSDLSYKTLIPCNLYGPYDTFTPGISHLLPAVIAKVYAAKNENAETVEIWGDGTARREFMYAGDAADGIWRAVSQFDSLPSVMNLGSGKDHSVNGYYAAAAQAFGWMGNFTHDLSKPVGMKQKLVDVSRQKEWGWEPQTSLAQGILKTADFYIERVVQ